MAGSYRHCVDSFEDVTDEDLISGKFRFDLIENMGDAYEACEMMYSMIQFLANGDGQKIRDAEDNFYDK